MPAGNSVKFISYNSTGMNSVKTNWIRDLIDVCGAHFMGIQEHFKETRSLNNFFKKQFPKFDCTAVPAHREEFRDTGRGKGGLAQLFAKGSGVQRMSLPTPGWRLQAQILRFGGWRLLWVNSYFPTDPRILNFDESELLAVQAELEAVLEHGGYDGCLVSGDFNYDARRNSGFCRSMADFLARVGLVSVWEQHPIDFTYLHTDNKSTSVLDNFFVDQGLLQYIEAAGPLHLGDNPSGHAPIMLTLRVPDVASTPADEQIKSKSRLGWNRAEKSQIDGYTANLKERLEKMEDLPECLSCDDVKCKELSHSRVRDSYLLDIMSHCIEAGYGSIPVVTPRPHSGEVAGWRGNSPSTKVSQQLPGWKENCEPASKAAKFWYSVWISAGRPVKCELHRIMVRTRTKFRVAVRKAKAALNSSKGRIFLQAAEAGDRALLGEMKKVMGSKHESQELPDSFEGAVGVDEILEKFGQLYSALYNSASTEEAMADLKVVVESRIDCTAEKEVLKITGEVVSKAAQSMKPGKVDVSQAYSSDIFCHAPRVLFDKLAVIFRSFMVHGTISLTALACSFMPLLKSARKDRTKFDSYRAVAGASQLLKLFEYTCLNLWGDYLQSDTLQFGFKPGTGTDQCTWLLTTVAEHHYLRGSSTLCCLLDVKKGFPSVKFADLFKICLDEKGLPPIVVRVMMFMYQEQEGHIKLQGRRSSSFPISNGMREGAAASPALWAVYADGILKELRRSGLGCHVAGMWCGAVMYADDLALMATNRAMLSEMLAIAVQHGAGLNLRFSSSQDPKKCKSFCIFFAGPQPARKIIYPAPLELNGVALPWRDSAVHLGHKLHQDLSMAADAKEKRARFISRSVGVRAQFGFAAPPQILKAVRILACDAYGSVLWRLDSPASSSFFSAYTSCIKRIYRLPISTHKYLVEGHLTAGIPPLRNMVFGRYPAFYQKLLRSPSTEAAVLANMAAKDARSVTAGNLRFLSGLTKLDCAEESSLIVKRALPVEHVPEKESWRIGLLDILLRQRAELEQEAQDASRVNAMLASLCYS